MFKVFRQKKGSFAETTQQLGLITYAFILKLLYFKHSKQIKVIKHYCMKIFSTVRKS